MKFLLAAFAALFISTSALAEGAEDAKAFVGANAQRVLSTLADTSLPLDEKKATFRALVDEVADVPRITRFVLGQYKTAARNPSYADQAKLDADIEVFSGVFREYAIGVYESRLGEYGGQTITVTGATARKPTDVIVATQVVDPAGLSNPLDVNWRVIFGADGPRVVDVEVFGVWLALNQRDEIVGILEKNKGRIPAATAALRSQIATRAATPASGG